MFVNPGGGFAPVPKPSGTVPHFTPPAPAPGPSAPSANVTSSGAAVDPKTGFSGSSSVGNSGQHPWDSDPAVIAAQNDYNTFKDQQDAWLRAQRAQAQAAFNGPNNQFSYMNQLGRADVDRIRAYKNSLAARGIVQSGEFGYQGAKEAQWKAQQQYTGEQALLAQLNDYLMAYTGNMSGARRDLNSALSTGYQNYLNNPEAYGHWSDPNSPGGYFPFTPTAITDPRTGASLITEYTK